LGDWCGVFTEDDNGESCDEADEESWLVAVGGIMRAWGAGLLAACGRVGRRALVLSLAEGLVN
jgi:hypothetical protein